MAYLRISDDALDHPKLSGLSDGAHRFWFNANCWCQKHLTDGKIVRSSVKAIPRYSGARVKELIAARLWHDEHDHYQIHDFLAHNDSRQHVERRRAYKRRHNDLYANPDLLRVVRERDGDACRYCGVQVNWHDRRGPIGATYDHVDPHGDNTVENVVVACRSCNSKKQDHKPEEVGLKLVPSQLPVGSAPSKSQLNTRHLTSPHLTERDTKTVSLSHGPSEPAMPRRNARIQNEGDPVPLWDWQFSKFRNGLQPKFGEDTVWTETMAWVHRVGDELTNAGVPVDVSDPVKWWDARYAADWGAGAADDLAAFKALGKVAK